MIRASSSRNNFTGILTDYEALELGRLITSVGKGSVTGNVRIYHNGDGARIKEILKRFGTKYPYSSITRYAGYVSYDCKKFNGNSQTYQRDRLLEDLQKVIAFTFNDRVQNPFKYIDEDSADYPKNTNSDKVNNGDDSDFMSKYGTFVYVGIGLVAFMLFYFMFEK